MRSLGLNYFFEIEELYEYVPSGVTPIIVYEDWVGIAHEICGE